MFATHNSLLFELNRMKRRSSVKDYEELYNKSTWKFKLKFIFSWSIGNGEVNATEMCLDQDKTIFNQVINKRCRLVLHMAINKGYIDQIKLYYKRNICINTKNRLGQTPILFAAYCGKAEIVQLLISLGANPYDETFNGEQILHLACKSGNYDCVKVILDMGHNVNEITNSGLTPIFFAVYQALNCNFEIIEELISRGANLMHVAENNDTLITESVMTGNLKLVKFIISHLLPPISQLVYNTCVYFGLLYGYLHIVKYAISQGGSLEYTKPAPNITLLQCAIRSGNVDCVQFLLKRGFALDNTFILDRQRIHRRYIYDATLSDSYEMMQFIVDKGCEPDNTVVENATNSLIRYNHCFGIAIQNSCARTLLWLLKNTNYLYESDGSVCMHYIEKCCVFARVTCLLIILRDLQMCQRLTHEIVTFAFHVAVVGQTMNHYQIVKLLQLFGYVTIDHQILNRVIANIGNKQSKKVVFLNNIQNMDWQLRVVYSCERLNVPNMFKSMLQNGFDITGTSDIKRITLFCKAPTDVPMSFSSLKDIKLIFKQALSPWSPKNHILHGRQYKRAIFNIFFFEYCCKIAKSTLPNLPKEVWMTIAESVQRSWFIESSAYNINNVFDCCLLDSSLINN